MTTRTYFQTWLITAAVCAVPVASHAQTPPAAPEYRFSGDFAFGWDRGLSGNINSSGVGRINNQAAVILKNKYEDVYGTGLHLRFGGGYMLDSKSEVRAAITIQSLDADLVQLGEIGIGSFVGPPSPRAG